MIHPIPKAVLIAHLVPFLDRKGYCSLALCNKGLHAIVLECFKRQMQCFIQSVFQDPQRAISWDDLTSLSSVQEAAVCKLAQLDNLKELKLSAPLGFLQVCAFVEFYREAIKKEHLSELKSENAVALWKDFALFGPSKSVESLYYFITEKLGSEKPRMQEAMITRIVDVFIDLRKWEVAKAAARSFGDDQFQERLISRVERRKSQDAQSSSGQKRNIKDISQAGPSLPDTSLERTYSS